MTLEEILRLLLAALAAKSGMAAPASAPPAAEATAPAAQPAVLSPIDNALGGQMLAGKKTALAIVAYAVLSVLQATDVAGPATGAGATTTGQILTTLIASFGGLGLTAKIDRIVKALGLIAAKKPQ